MIHWCSFDTIKILFRLFDHDQLLQWISEPGLLILHYYVKMAIGLAYHVWFLVTHKLLFNLLLEFV